MEEPGIVALPEQELARTPAKGVLLSILLAIILAGALPLLSSFMRGLTWVIWIALAGLIYRFSKELPVLSLFRPAAPYLAWLCFYLAWALIVSPNTDLKFALKVASTTLVLALCMAIITAEPEYLRTFASAVQFAVAGNLFVFFLMLRSPQSAAYMQTALQHSEAYEVSSIRFGGLWGNPNMAGYICLIATILSVLAIPWIAWLGRLSCLPLLYLAASRKALALYLVILILYLIMVRGRNVKFWLVAMTTAVALFLAFSLGEGPRAVSRVAREDPAVARILDLGEMDTRMRGEQTRLDLLHQWTTALTKAPWYGFGLQAMAGTVYAEDNPQQIVSKGPFPLGTHNTYLGVLIDVGPVGFIAFLLLMLHYARLCLLSKGGPMIRWVLTSLLICNLVILLVSHNHLFCFEGKMTFALLFLLPTCLGLQELGQRLDPET